MAKGSKNRRKDLTDELIKKASRLLNSLSTSDILTILRFHFYNVNISARIHPPLKQRIPLKS
jgi:hypothetical protein